MSKPNLAKIYISSWRFQTVVILLGIILTLGFSMVQTMKYSSTVRLLITQTNVTGVDPYTVVKSNERIAQNLTQIIQTSSFYNSVVASASVDKTYFPSDEIQKRKLWEDTVETSVTPGTGVMSVVAFHPLREQATNIVVKVAEELVSQAPNYFGYSVRVQIIDDPLPSAFYAKPDFIKNSAFGAILGFLLGSIWILAKVRK